MSNKYLGIAMKKAIKQEVNAVLDKIRTEIEAKCCITVGSDDSPAITLHDVFEIIDKYVRYER